MHHQDAMNEALLAWYGQVKRDLPWRRTKNPYHIWISEIMLQQTRVETVKGYYARFLAQFPTVDALARAPEEAVLKAWEGLGYYSRARNLQKAARTVAFELDGTFPNCYEEILKLSGIGAYTAGAIASIAFGERVPAIDGNVYRVASRFFGIREDVGIPAVQRRLHDFILESLPDDNVGDYNNALMELGATVCIPASPRCEVCPWHMYCDAFAEGDADLLPIHEKKRPPKAMDVAVCLLTFGDSILVMRRKQRMLHGLYVFDLIEDESTSEGALDTLRNQGLHAQYLGELGTARHVFTHRIWEMVLFHFQLKDAPSPDALTALDGRMVNREELYALPFPTAMKAAYQQAISLLAAE